MYYSGTSNCYRIKAISDSISVQSDAVTEVLKFVADGMEQYIKKHLSKNIWWNINQFSIWI